MLPAGGRVAVYYCPDRDDPLYAAGRHWLGRDPTCEEPFAQPALAGIEDITAEARGYGFHATLKPPMRLADGARWPDFLDAVRALADRIAPFELPLLAVTDLHGFLALRETVPCAALQRLADACVVELDRFRAPPSEAELARRRRSRLSPAHEAMLARYGYPYVLDEWFFHMTLTRRLDAAEHAFWRPAAEAFFAGAVHVPRHVMDICLFTQEAPGAPFVIAARIPLRG
jgi:putative phosphonate metabolism protein